MASYQKLEVWQEAIELNEYVYKRTQRFPRQTQYTYVSQMRRSALSIPSNIAEGHGRNSKKEFRRFIHYAFGSAKELETQLVIARRLELGDIENLEKAVRSCFPSSDY
ncbi:MAG: hypothetical protein AMXMBFR16_00270 [Candidatus Uhrbacteria bacterium]